MKIQLNSPYLKGCMPSPSKLLIKIVTNDILSQCTIRTMKDDGTPWLYEPDKGFFDPADTVIHTICAEFTPLNSPASTKALMHSIRGLTYIDRKDFTPPDGFLNLSNGVLNIETMKLLPYSADYNFINRLEIEFDIAADCPAFISFLSEVLDPADIKTVQEWFGYHLMRGQPLKKAMFHRGEHDTGKSTLLAIQDAFIGTENLCHFQLPEFNNPTTHALPSLYGKFANTYGDMGNVKISDAGKFKMLTGNDKISARKHYKEPFYFVNGAKLTFACNKLPDLSDVVIDDDAFWERIIIVPFNHQIAKDKRNPALAELIIKDEMSGVLNWALEGYKRLSQSGFSVIVPGYADYVKDIWLMDCLLSHKSSP